MESAALKLDFDKYLRVKEAARFLGVSVWTLRNWDRSGKLKPRRHPINGYRIYLEDDLAALLQSQRYNHETPAPAAGRSEAGKSRQFACFYENDNTLTGSEVTERRRAEEVKALLAAVIESSEDAVITKNLKGTILSWNRAAERLFGYSASEAIGQSITILIPPDRMDEEHMIIGRLRRRERIEHYETVRRTKDGRMVDLSLSISPVCDESGNILGASKIARDITEQKRLQEALKQAARRKDEFLATLAHELRNPLAPIRNALHILKISGSREEMKEEAYQIMERQLHQMTRLIDDLMDASRISQGKIELQKKSVAVSEVMETAIEIASPHLLAKKHKLVLRQPEEAIWLDADIVRLSQIFANLLNNAAKYTDEGGEIIFSARQAGDEAVLSVKDNGIGIPRQMLSSVFEMFVQVDGGIDRAQGGLGIGLTLVKELTQLHGGHIVAESDGEGKGSTFSVFLPVHGKKQAAAENHVPAEQGDAYRILVVDDNRAAAKTMGWALELQGHSITLAHDATTAIETAKALRPDVILLDIGMPGTDGYEICKQLRQEPLTRNALVIAQTGWSQNEHRTRSQEAGFDHHLVKPVNMDKLQELLSGLGAAPNE